MDYSLIKQFVTVPMVLESYGAQPDAKGRCACPIHGGDNKTAFSISSDKQTWKCHTKCDAGGDIFTLVERIEGISSGASRSFIMEKWGLEEDEPPPKTKPKVKPTVVNKVSHIYRDKDGEEVYRVNRVNMSDGSKQCYQECNGKNTLPPEVRTLYNYDKLYGYTGHVYLCEGEKTADALTECGFVATTNPLGSKSWCQSYANLLKDMKVVIMPDADSHGEVWRDVVLSSLEGVAQESSVINVPEKFIKKHTEYSGHDFADMLAKYGPDSCSKWLREETSTAKVLVNGIDQSILGRPLDGYRELKRRADAGIRSDVFNLNEWLPSMDLIVNKGDLVVIMAGTGVGKTRALHNLPYHIRSINYAMFDLELSFETLCERYTAMHNGCSVRNVKERMARGFGIDEPSINNVFIQKQEKLTVSKMRDRVDKIEQLSQQKVHAVGIDYIGLMAGNGSAYESTSNNVEEFKGWVAETDRVGIMTTQVARPADKENGMYECPSPFSAKNSGSIENSAQELIGIWRPSEDKREMRARCLKYTHGEYYGGDIELIANDLRIQEVER
jgi:5S rRNA maturation endonuclease (ribonuclease M5)